MAVFGVNKRVEVGVNAYFTKFGRAGHSVQIYNGEKNGIAVAAGAVLYIPLTDRSEADTFGSVYTAVSKQVKGEYCPRFTVRGYHLMAQEKEIGSAKGLTLGYEHLLHKRVYFIADWNTSKNRFGYAAAGLAIKVSERSGLYTANYFGNEGRSNNFLGVYYGISF